MDFCKTYQVKTAGQWKNSPVPRYEDKKFWQQLDHKSSFISYFLSETEIERVKPIPELTASSFMGYKKTGIRDPYSFNFNLRRKRLALFAVAECIYRDGKLLDHIIDEIWAICEESSWIAPAHIRVHGDGQGDEALPSLKHDGYDLLVAMTANALAETLYMMESVLDPIVAERIRLELERRVFGPAREKEYKWFYYGSNWTSVCVGGTISAALYAEQNVEKLKQLLNKFMPYLIENYIDGFTSDGGTSEGISCWNLGFKHYLYTADILAYATNHEWTGFSDERVNRITEFPLNTYMGNGQFPTFSEPSDRFLPYPWVINYIGKVTKSDSHIALLNELETYYDIPDVVRPEECYMYDLIRIISWWEADRSNRKQVSKLMLQEYTYLPELQWLTIPGKGDLQIAAKGGHNAEMHNHNDLGTIIVHSKDSEPFLADLARGAMTRSYFLKSNRYNSLEANSFGHNVPRINGKLQLHGPQYYAVGNETKVREGNVLEWDVDLIQAYDKNAGILKLKRQLLIGLKTIDKFTIKDHFELEKPGIFESVFYTYADKITFDTGEVILSFKSGNSLKLIYDQEKWGVDVKNVNADLSRQRDYLVHRIIWTNKKEMHKEIFEILGETI